MYEQKLKREVSGMILSLSGERTYTYLKGDAAGNPTQ